MLSLNICICKVMLSLVIAGDVPIIEEQQTFVRLLNYFEEALNGEVIILTNFNVSVCMFSNIKNRREPKERPNTLNVGNCKIALYR